MWRNYHRIIKTAIARSYHEPNPTKTGKAYRHFAVVGENVGFNSTPISRNSIKSRYCHAEQDVLRKLSPGKYDSLFVGRLASDFNEENLKFGNSKPCMECVDRIKNAKNDGIIIKKILWTNGEGGIDSSSVDKLESNHMTLHQRTLIAEHSACCLHDNHHHHNDDDDESDEDYEDDDDEAKRREEKKKKENEKIEELENLYKDPENIYKIPYSVKLFGTLGLLMGVPYVSILTIIDCF